MPSKHAHYFTSSSEWYAWSATFSAPPETDPSLTPQAQRDAEARWAAAWSAKHPASDDGYGTRIQAIRTRDGASINLKIYEPLHDSVDAKRDKRLPILFVTHGDAWTQGSAITEEVFFLRELLTQLPLASLWEALSIVSLRNIRFLSLLMTVGMYSAGQWRVQRAWEVTESSYT